MTRVALSPDGLEAALRREWRRRLVDHDGDGDSPGGIERWLKLAERVSGMLANYDWITRETLSYFNARMTQAPTDSAFALAYIEPGFIPPGAYDPGRMT